MRLVVLYGSQTGTAENVAEQIWRESKRFGFAGPVLPLDEYVVQQLTEEQLVVFVVSTTGNGDEPDNMVLTWKLLLRRSLPPKLFQGLHFACLGLGDSSYSKFNWVAKKLNKRLLQLGATAIMPLGLCDDQHDYGLNAVALPWVAQLWKELAKTCPLQEYRAGETCAVKTVFKWHAEVLAKTDQLVDLDCLRWPLKVKPHRFMVAHNVRTTAHQHFQDVRLLQFQMPDGVIWQPGDILQVYPCNSDEHVATFFELVKEHCLDFTADTIVQLKTAHEDMPLPAAFSQPTTIGWLAKYVWDLSAKPRQRAFELMALNCEDDLEKEKLEEFTTAEGLDSLIAYINRPRRTTIEVLQDFRHATSKLTLPLLFEFFPVIQARSFSIASIPAMGTLDLLVAVVEYRTKLSTPRLGLCSNWLKGLSAGVSILGAIKPGTMSFPKGLHTPIVMVGPGTGIAPFRALIQSREKAKQSGVLIGPLVVFFGCRSKNKDFHFCDDFSKWQNTKLIECFVAFSRDQEHKIYVQDLIKKNSTRLSALIRDENAFILVAGSSNNMPQAVKEAFIHVLNGDHEYVEQMVKTKRYQEETWS